MPEQLPSLSLSYETYLGGIPDDLDLRPGLLAAASPYIGCIRDVLVRYALVLTGPQVFSQCYRLRYEGRTVQWMYFFLFL